MYKYCCLRWRLSVILNSKTKKKKETKKKERKKGVVDFRLVKQIKEDFKRNKIRYSSGSDKLLLMMIS